MLNWIIANIGTIIVGTALAVGLFFIIRSMVKKKTPGFCNCGCENCSGRKRNRNDLSVKIRKYEYVSDQGK